MATMQSVKKLAKEPALCRLPTQNIHLLAKLPHDMFQAATAGDYDWLFTSIKHLKSLTERDKQGLTVLHVAAQYGHLNCLKLLVECREMDVNIRCPHGKRPIHMVLSPESKPNSYYCLTYLLAYGAQVNVSTDEGVTPLHLAAAEGLTECVKLLVEFGADTHACDVRGDTPLDLARLWGHKVIARFLRNAMWHKNKTTDMERRQALQSLKENLIWKHRKAESREKLAREAIAKQKVSEWAKKKGFAMHLPPLTRTLPLSHAYCQSAEPFQTKNIDKLRPNATWNTSPNPSKPPPAIISRSPGVRIGIHAEKIADKPDLRQSVTLGSSVDGRRNCTASWDGITQEVPDLPLDVIQKCLFPSEFPARIACPSQFHSTSLQDLPHRGGTPRSEDSPWTEVAMHLVEELQPGHY